MSDIEKKSAEARENPGEKQEKKTSVLHEILEWVKVLAAAALVAAAVLRRRLPRPPAPGQDRLPERAPRIPQRRKHTYGCIKAYGIRVGTRIYA